MCEDAATMQNLDTARNTLLTPTRLWPRADILSRPCPVPAAPGVYAWYFDAIPPSVPTDDCITHGGLTLLYIGISPKPPPTNGRAASKQTLRSRLHYHMRGNAYGSTLRLSLGCLLSDTLGIRLQRVGSGTRLTFGSGEARLSEWLGAHAFVTWYATDQPHALETTLIRTLSLPLNLDQNTHHPFHTSLTGYRRAAREQARL